MRYWSDLDLCFSAQLVQKIIIIILLKRLKASRDIDEFLRMSYHFADNLGLTQCRCKEPLKILKSHGIEAGVALFGETIFTIVPLDRVNYAKQCLKSFEGTLIVCNIDNTGARVL